MGLGTTITSEPFLVLRRLDIREDAELQKPARVNISRRIVDKWLLLCGGAIEAVFTIEKTGHLPGDDIVIDGEVDNNSRRVIKLIQVRTGMHIHAYGHYDTVYVTYRQHLLPNVATIHLNGSRDTWRHCTATPNVYRTLILQ